MRAERIPKEGGNCCRQLPSRSSSVRAVDLMQSLRDLILFAARLRTVRLGSDHSSWGTSASSLEEAILRSSDHAVRLELGFVSPRWHRPEAAPFKDERRGDELDR